MTCRDGGARNHAGLHLCPAAARYRLLPQRLAARPQAARQPWSTSAQPVVRVSGPKTIPPEGAATTARCSPAPYAAAGRNPYGVDLGHFVETGSHASHPAASRSPQCPCRREDRAHLVLPWIHQVFSNLKGWARGVYPGMRSQASAGLSHEFVFRFNRRNPPRCFPLALPPRHQCRTPYLQHVDRTGAMCISGIFLIRKTNDSEASNAVVRGRNHAGWLLHVRTRK